MNDPEKVRLRLSPPERRDRIIASAKTVLAKGGLRGFGLAAVAREAGIAIGLIGHYFGGIDGLVRAMLASVVANRQDRKHHTSHTLPDAIAALTAIVERNFDPQYYSRDNLLVWLPIYELSMHDADMRDSVGKVDQQDVVELQEVLTSLVTHLGLSADPADMAQLFFALLDGMWLRWCYSGRDGYDEEKLRAIRFLEDRIGPFYPTTGHRAG